MRPQNLFELKSGLNQFTILQSDLGPISGKIPILSLPSSYKIKNIYMNVLQPFKSNLVSGQTNLDACIKNRVMIGTNEDSQELLTWTEETADSRGDSSSNTGTYFNNPNSKTIDTDIVIESWISLRVWLNSGDLNTARFDLAGAGSQTAGLSFGGYTTTYVNTTEEYNGSSWSSGGALATARQGLGGCGTQTAGLSFGGFDGSNKAAAEEYNGTSWSSAGGNLNTAVYGLAGCGSQPAALSFGGYSSLYTATTEEYNGSSWSVSNDLNTARRQLAGCGTQTAGLSFGGSPSGGAVTEVTEEYNGTNWFIENSLNISRRYLSGCGIQNSGICFGGYYTDLIEHTEEFDGINWIIGNILNIGRRSLSGCGSQTAGLSFGGLDISASNSATTEEYNNIDMNELSLSGEMILNITVI